MKKSLFLTLTLFSIIVLAQVGIGNSNPRGLLDVNDNPSGNATGGLVLPTTDQTSSILNPQDGSISNVTATTIYDSSLDCIRVIKNDGTYSNCLDDDNNNDGGGNSSFYCDGLNNLKTYSTVFSTISYPYSSITASKEVTNGTSPLNSIITFMDNDQDIYYSGQYGASQAQLSTDWIHKNTKRENIITRVNVLSEVLDPLNKQWKQFIALNSPEGYYTSNTQISGVFLLSEDGDLYFTIHPYINPYDYKIPDFNNRSDLRWQLPAVAGRDAENYTISTSDNTPLSWVWKINDGLTNSLGNPLKFDEIIFQDASVVVAYCAEDNQVYTWGGRGMYSTAKATAYDQELLREANTLTECLTPTLAVDINLITNRNNTRVSLKGDKIMDVANITDYYSSIANKYNAAFITEDGYFNSWDIRNPSNGNYRVHVNGGVKLKGVSLIYNDWYGLGDNGKIYNIPRLVNGWGGSNISLASGAVHPTSQDQEVIIPETDFFNTHFSSSSLNIIDMSSDEGAGGNSRAPYLIALTSDGSIYLVPKGSDPVINLTTTYDLPSASKLLGIRRNDIYIVGSDNKSYVINNPEDEYSDFLEKDYLISKHPYDIPIDKNDNIFNGNYSKIYKCVAFPY